MLGREYPALLRVEPQACCTSAMGVRCQNFCELFCMCGRMGKQRAMLYIQNFTIFFLHQKNFFFGRIFLHQLSSQIFINFQ